MFILIRPVNVEDYRRVHEFQCEYLDNESLDSCMARIQTNPDLYIAAFDEEELVGICYGHPSKKNETSINLQGIAVNLDVTKNYARKGIGSMLIQRFEQTAKVKGYTKIDVGAADDVKVEHFYLKNGFTPYELVAIGHRQEQYERVNISDYDRGKVMQMALRNKYKPKEVIFIFEKSIE